MENRAETRIIDPCLAGAPTLNNLLRSGYRLVTTHAPWLWSQIYRSVERRDFSKQHIPMMHLAERALDAALREFQPSIIASTYPLYPYFLDRSFRRGIPRCPVVTIVTDSITINAAWRKAPTDYWIVTDRRTRKALIDSGLPEGKLIETGFPVDPRFGDLQPLAPSDSARPFRVLFFPTSKRPTVRHIARTILDHHDWPTELTIVLGRNVRQLYKRAREIKEAYPGRVRIRGWSRRIPELLCSHHLVVGKAGGATVHEALAARCPMLILHLVPGQEAGNLQLLQMIGRGGLADTAEALASSLRDLLADHAALWRHQKRQLNRHARPQAALSAANFLLNAVPPSPS